MQLRKWSVLVLACTMSAGAAGAWADSLQSLLDVPFPTSLVAAADARRIAWIANEHGARNVWTAVEPDYVPAPLTATTQDDGQALAELQLSRDGATAIWVRGGSPDPRGFSANPAGVVGGVEQEIWTARTTEGSSRKFGSGHSPVISPDGKLLLFVHGGLLNCQSLWAEAASPAWCTSPLLRLRGTNNHARFSPDGKRIVFVSDRGDHSFVGVFDTKGGGVRWLAPDVDRDDFPVWSPDSTHVAFIRMAGLKQGELFDITGAWPFEIWVADVDTSKARRVFRSSAAAGGFAQFSGEVGPGRGPLQWAAGNQLLFYSEQSGWMHLHAISAEEGTNGADPRDLTPGGCEVESSSLSADGSTALVSGNCAQIDGRQIFEVSVTNGRAPPRLVSGMKVTTTIDTEPTYIGRSQRYAFLNADAIMPTAVTLATSKGRSQRIFPQSLSGFPAQSLVTPRVVTFQAEDGLTVHGQLFEVQGATRAARRPGLVFVHGGPIRQMLPGWHYIDYYRNAYALNQYLASRGFVVLSVNYRAGTGYGQSFRRAANQGPRGASEYQDVLAARRYLASLADVDTARIGIWGGSYGGLLAAQALARNSDLFAAGVDYHGVHDWSRFGRELNGGGWALDESSYARALESSPLGAIKGWRSPVLLIHGDDDRSAPFNQTVDLAQRLREQGVPVETLVFPDEEHDFLRHSTVLEAYRATVEFFERALRP